MKKQDFLTAINSASTTGPGGRRNIKRALRKYFAESESSDGSEDDSSSGSDSTPQVQSDWNQNDDTKVDYIKNKPTILAPMIVEGLLERKFEAEDTELLFLFAENSGQPSWAEAHAQMLAGGILYIYSNGSLCLMVDAEEDYIAGSPGDGTMFFWYNPDTVIPE